MSEIAIDMPVNIAQFEKYVTENPRDESCDYVESLQTFCTWCAIISKSRGVL